MPLYIVRHAESLWNLENKFTGWKDIDLSPKGINDSKEMAELLNLENINCEYIFTSDLLRTIHTSRPICKLNIKALLNSSELRERDYGDLTGMNKTEAEKQLGEDMFKKIRRGFYEKPPNGESLEDVTKRVGSYYDSVVRSLEKKHNVIIIAHGNSLRALLVHLNIFTPENISQFEIQSCVPIKVDIKNKEISYINKYKLKGLQILDSRGFPTIQVTCINKLTKEIMGKGSSPSGASCGSTEALELRDNNKDYLMGKSILNAIEKLDIINKYIPLNDTTIGNLKLIDEYLIKLDPTDNKNILGGNTTTAVSFCMLDVASKYNKMEIYKYISSEYNNNNVSQYITPFVNIINGGKHGVTDDLKIQEFMIFPKEEYDIYKKQQIVCEVYHSLKKILCDKYGDLAKSIGDEGGFCPPIKTAKEAFDNIIEAVEKIGYTPGVDVFLAIDCAASEFYNFDTDLYEVEKNKFITGDELIQYYGDLINKYPMLRSIEDCFYEKDFNTWKKFTELYGDKIMIVGDDLFTTNSKLIKYGLESHLANSLLLKVNQIGTISEAIESAKMFSNNNVIVSHRSGETNHAYIIDLAKGIGAQYVKIGSPCRGERVEKFNRLMELFSDIMV